MRVPDTAMTPITARLTPVSEEGEVGGAWLAPSPLPEETGGVWIVSSLEEIGGAWLTPSPEEVPVLVLLSSDSSGLTARPEPEVAVVAAIIMRKIK